MKKKGILIFLFFFSLFFLFGTEQNFGIKINSYFGPNNIILNEILKNKKGNDSTTSSLLKWESYGLPSFELQSEIRFFNNLYMNVSGIYVVPASSGKLQDYDWMNLFSTGGTEQTHYSIHDNFLDNYIKCNTGFGYIFTPTEQIEITPFFSFRYSYLSMTCSNGYRQYGTKIGEQNGSNIYEPWTSEIPKTQLTGKVITFEEQNYFFGIGTQISFKISNSFEAQVLAQVLPAIKSTALDTHHRRNTKYTLFDNTFKLALDSSFLLQYKVTDRHRFNLKAGYCYSFSKDIPIYQSAGKQNWIGATNPGALLQHDFTLTAGYTHYYEK